MTPRIALLLLLLLPSLVTGCASSLDVNRARRWLDPPQTAALPELGAPGTASLPSPRGLRATSGQLRAIPLQWDPLLSGDVAGYAVERASDREGPFEPVAALAGLSTTAWVDEGPSHWPGAEGGRKELGDGETLYYRLRAFAPDGGLASSVSEVVAATTAPPPDPPEGLRAFSHQPREVPLSWQASANPWVAGYVVERSPTSRGPFSDLAEIDGRFSTVYLDENLGDLRVFHYRVAALNRAGGRGQPSKPVRAVTKPEPLPPLGFSLSGRKLGINELAWQPNVEADLAGYRLLRRRQGADETEPVASLPPQTTRVRDTLLGANETVTYTLVAFDSDGLESNAAHLDVTSVGYDLSAIARQDGVHLAWNPRREEGFTRAHVFLLGLRRTELGSSEDGTFHHREAKPGGRYRYAVVLERADGTLAPESSPVEIRLPKP